MTIMIIEDDEAIRNELNNLVKNAGYETILLEDFSNTLEMVLNSKVD